jgi:ABC-type molybdenum transport system ATPase subunit/photorepair protein PhrA
MSLPADSREPVHPTRKPTGPESNHAALLQARGLSFARNDEPIFGPLDFEVAPGEALLVHGGNGSGKTTLLRVLAGLLEPGSGEIRIAGGARNPRGRCAQYRVAGPSARPQGRIEHQREPALCGRPLRSA